MDAVGFGYLDFGHSGFEHGFQLLFLPIKQTFAAAFRSAQFYAFGFLAGKGFAGALADELAFYFCAEAESEGKDFAGDVVAQAVVVLDGPDLGTNLHAAVEDGHDHEEGAAKAADFGADDDVVFAHAFQKFAKAAFVYLLCATDGLGNPFVDLQVVVPTEAVDFEALVFDCLAVGADADVSVYHFSAKVQKAIIPGKYDADIKAGNSAYLFLFLRFNFLISSRKKINLRT